MAAQVPSNGLNIDKGLSFPATVAGQSGANVLDDYEEGTFTATITDGTNAVTLSQATMTYRKVGTLVHINGYLVTNGLGSASGAVHITGLPFAVPNTNAAYASVNIGYAGGLNINANGHVSGYFAKAESIMPLVNWDATSGITNFAASELSADGSIILSGTYYVA